MLVLLLDDDEAEVLSRALTQYATQDSNRVDELQDMRGIASGVSRWSLQASSLPSRATIEVGGRRFVLTSGVTVGVLRRMADPPDITLPAEEGFSFASHDHGCFTFRNGAWRFTNHGRNGTRIHRDGEWYVIGGMPFELKSGDELEFGNGLGIHTDEILGRIRFKTRHLSKE